MLRGVKNLTVKPASRWEAPLEPRPEEKVRAVIRELHARAGEKILSMTSGDPPNWGWGNQPLSTYLIEDNIIHIIVLFAIFLNIVLYLPTETR